MPDQDPSSDTRPDAHEQAERKEQSSGKDEGDRVEGKGIAKAEDVERNSGGISDQS